MVVCDVKSDFRSKKLEVRTMDCFKISFIVLRSTFYIYENEELRVKNEEFRRKNCIKISFIVLRSTFYNYENEELRMWFRDFGRRIVFGLK